MTATSESNLAGYGELIRKNHNFQMLWYGQIISLLGDWFDLIASASLIGMLTGSGLAIGGLFVVRMLAPFLISPAAGVAADRYNRKHLLVAADLMRAAVVLGFLFVRTPGQVWLLYTVTAIQLGLSGVFFPARRAILPDIVTRRELGAANALTSATWSVMLAIGAALGGFAAGQWGLYPAFVIDSATFVLSAFFISRIRYDRPPALEGADQTIAAGFRQYIGGLKYLGDNRDILAITLIKAALSFFIAGVFQVAQVELAERLFVIGEGGSTSLGLMYAVVGIGTGLGPIIVRRWTGDRDRPLRIAIVISFVIAAVGMVIAATLANFGVVLFGSFLRGVGSGVGWVFSTQLLLMLVPDRVRGRVFSTEFALQTLMSALSALGAGWALDNAMSVGPLLFWMGVLTVLPALAWGLWVAMGRHAPPLPDDDPNALVMPLPGGEPVEASD